VLCLIETGKNTAWLQYHFPVRQTRIFLRRYRKIHRQYTAAKVFYKDKKALRAAPSADKNQNCPLLSDCRKKYRISFSLISSINGEDESRFILLGQRHF
jgi:hypothetical protein